MNNEQTLINYITKRTQADNSVVDDLFATYVRSTRKNKGLSREQLVNQIGIHKNRLIAIENGLLHRDELTVDEIHALEDRLELAFLTFIQRVLKRLRNNYQLNI